MNADIQKLTESIGSVIVGKEKVIRCVIAGLLCNGHILIEDVPGVGKTQLAAALSRSIGGSFNRIQLTPDIMPSDITGYSMVNQTTFELEYRAGAAMCNFLLADEINRTSPKTQSSLLEAMQEEKVSVDGVTYELPQPFMVIATQNPVELAGTYPLPEAQLDRFLMKLSLGYPDQEGEKHVIAAGSAVRRDPEVKAVATCEDIIRLQDEVNKIYLSDNVTDYILRLLSATRTAPELALGLSPRAGISLAKTAKALAFLSGRNYVLPDDVKSILIPVCAHRLMLTREAKASGRTAAEVLDSIRKKVSVE